MLISSRNTFKDITKNNVLPAIWVALNLVKLTHTNQRLSCPGPNVMKVVHELYIESYKILARRMKENLR
jgi:hypothetical protein